MKLLEIEPEGQKHSGIADAKNIARCTVKLMEDGFKFMKMHRSNTRRI